MKNELKDLFTRLYQEGERNNFTYKNRMYINHISSLNDEQINIFKNLYFSNQLPLFFFKSKISGSSSNFELLGLGEAISSQSLAKLSHLELDIPIFYRHKFYDIQVEAVVPLVSIDFKNLKIQFIHTKSTDFTFILAILLDLIIYNNRPERDFEFLSIEDNEKKLQLWIEAIETILPTLKENSSSLNKVVLSQTKELKSKGPINHWDLFKLLKKFNKDSYQIFWQNHGHSFNSFSPESLIVGNNEIIKIDAIAGTIARGATKDSDLINQSTLLNDQKELNEHQIVVNQIVNQLKDFGEINIDKKSILKLSKVQHIKTPITLKLNKKSALSKIITLLHPTPAVGGNPKDEALRIIKSIELNFFNQERNYYASPIGIVRNNNFDIAVGIRSLEVEHRSISLYAGAGIVSESVPENEWQEINNKFLSFFPYSIKEQISPQLWQGELRL